MTGEAQPPKPLTTSVLEAESQEPRDLSLEAAAIELRDALCLAFAVYASVPDGGRKGAIVALNAVRDFIAGANPLRGQSLELPLALLGGALADLEDGTVHPMLKPSPLRGKPSDSTGRATLRGVAAAIMTIIMKFGLERREAAMKVAAALNAKGVKLGGRQQLTWKTIANWRDQMTQANENDPALAAYKLMMSRHHREIFLFPGERFSGDTLKRLVEPFLAGLAENVALLHGSEF